MTAKVTVELPDDLIHQVQSVAQRTQRSFDDVLADWIRLAGSEPVLQSLSDADLLALCDNQLEVSQQDLLSELLDRNREGELNEAERQQLDDLMRTYRSALVRKAQAIKVAVERGLRPRLS